MFNESVSRIGKILSEGEVRYDTLLLHNQTSGWKCFDNGENADIQKYDDGSEFVKKETKKELKTLELSGKWEITNCSENILTLDTCDVYFDGKIAGKGENAIDVLYMALDLKRKVNVRCEFIVDVKAIPDNVFLVCETPEKFSIKVNGKEIDKTDKGYFTDNSFRKLSLSGLLREGRNVISTEIDFAPNPKIYEDLEKAYIFETEKNKLTFETEFESIYIVGDFAVNTDGEFSQIEREFL